MDSENLENLNENAEASTKVDEVKHEKKKKSQNKDKKKKNIWWIKCTIIALVLAALISLISEVTITGGALWAVIIVLVLLIIISIIFDCIGVAVTSCDITPIISMSSRKIYGAKTAMWLLKHSSSVASVCNDIIGDICGIISGACAAAIVLKIAFTYDVSSWEMWLSILISSLVSAFTIGGKAFMKSVAINNSKAIVIGVAKFLALFSKEERKRRKKEKDETR